MNLNNPVNIGQWKSYDGFILPKQRTVQLDNLYPISELLYGSEGQLQLIYTETIDELCKYLDEVSKMIKVENTETVLIDEVFYTTKIEGANTTRIRTAEIHDGAPISEDNSKSELMVLSGFRATKLLNLHPGKMSKPLLCEVWGAMIDGCCDNWSIRGLDNGYRTGNVQVGKHVGIDYENVDMYMDLWIDFYNSSEFDEKPFLKASILHYAFENIHPFCDGNGRMGRLLMNNYLIGQGIDSARAVSFSMAIDNTRHRYEAAFDESENGYADCTPFAEYMLTQMATAYTTASQVATK